jgi:hypothetical protein
MSYRSDNHASYDHTLLSSVPDPTRAEKQEGYNVGLLEESRDRRAPSPPANGAAPEQNGGALDYSPGAVSYARKEEPAATNEYEAVEKRVPWYRTRKGMIGIGVVALLIIIGAAVGGGVGGSHHSHSSNNNNSTNEVGQSNNTQGVDKSGNSTSTSPTPTSSSTVGGLSQGVAPSSSPGLSNIRRVA